MKADVLGITAANGIDHFSQRERFKIFAQAGFKSVMLAWGSDDDRKESISLAAEYGLEIENAHSNMRGCNPLWVVGRDGDEKESALRKTVEDCGKYGIRTMVMHLSNGFDVPRLSTIGLKRVERILDSAKNVGVTVALENVRVSEHLRYVLDNYTDEHVKFCFDAGHANIWCKDIDWLALYRNRLAALHLHDNDGEEDEHRIPLSGTVTWDAVLQSVRKSSYCGALTIETEVSGIRSMDEFTSYIEKVYAAGKILSERYVSVGATV